MPDLEVSRRERKKDETRERIFKEAIRLFRERGFDKTTIDDITEGADVAKGTFFNYFPKKEAVLAYLSEKRLAAAEENAGVTLASDRPASEKLIGIYLYAASAYEEDRELSRFVLGELMSRAFGPNEESGQRWNKLVLDVLEQGRASKELRPDFDLERVESLLASVYMATVYLWTNCPEIQFELRPELEARLRLVLEGIARKDRS